MVCDWMGHQESACGLRAGPGLCPRPLQGADTAKVRRYQQRTLRQSNTEMAGEARKSSSCFKEEGRAQLWRTGISQYGEQERTGSSPSAVAECGRQGLIAQHRWKQVRWPGDGNPPAVGLKEWGEWEMVPGFNT